MFCMIRLASISSKFSFQATLAADITEAARIEFRFGILLEGWISGKSGSVGPLPLEAFLPEAARPVEGWFEIAASGGCASGRSSWEEASSSPKWGVAGGGVRVCECLDFAGLFFRTTILFGKPVWGSGVDLGS